MYPRDWFDESNKGLGAATQAHPQAHQTPPSLLQLLLCLWCSHVVLLLCLAWLTAVSSHRQASRPVQRNWLKNLPTRSQHTNINEGHRWLRHWPTGSGGGWRGGGTISLLGCARNPSRYEQTLLNHFANKRTSFIFLFIFFFPMRRGCTGVHCLNLSARGGLHPSIRPSVLLRLMRLFPLHCGSAANWPVQSRRQRTSGGADLSEG